jgi:putative addiction module CopG family antidote
VSGARGGADRPSCSPRRPSPARCSARVTAFRPPVAPPTSLEVCSLIARRLYVWPSISYDRAMDNVTLPPELERFAAEAVAAGRYRDVSDVVAAGVSLLQRQEQARAELLASVLAARDEAERDGCVTGDEMVARVRARLAEKYGAAV